MEYSIQGFSRNWSPAKGARVSKKGTAAQWIAQSIEALNPIKSRCNPMNLFFMSGSACIVCNNVAFIS